MMAFIKRKMTYKRHNFPAPNADCLNCGINQMDLSAQFQPKPQPKKEVKTRKQTPLQYVAGEIWEAYGRPKNYKDVKGKQRPFFPLLLGLIKRKGMNWGYETLSNVKEWKRLEKGKYPLQLLMYNSKNETNKITTKI